MAGVSQQGSRIMSEQGPARGDGYRAFISYSHSDERIAKWLHKRLETYHLPKKLIGASGARGAVPPRLTPIFRDIDELSAANDLSVEIKAALARSDVLIILCSPAAKASKWVNLEIETFRTLHGGSRPVLAALIDGEPADAFPPALTAYGQEPVAADFRKGRDGKRLALLKLAAGIAGAPLDALVQRDAQRQNRRVMAITGGALAASLVMALLLVVALRSQAEAQRQRAEAEGLVEYMLTDLRDKLKGDIGRLSVMTAVNERAMQYYSKQINLSQLPKESLERRSRILHAMGEDDEKKGNLKSAQLKFLEAHRTTLEILRHNPDDTTAIFNHAQSEYWLGESAYQQFNIAESKIKFFNYLFYAKKLTYIDNNNFYWLREIAYAYGNLCATSFENPVDINLMRISCNKHLDILIHINNYNSKYINVTREIANAYAWMADYYYLENEYLKSENMRELQNLILLKNNKTLVDNELYMISCISYAEILFFNKKYKRSRIMLNTASIFFEKLTKIDSINKKINSWSRKINLLEGKLNERKI